MKKVKKYLNKIKWLSYEKWLFHYFKKKSFHGLSNKEFSIFANNCTAGFIYQDAGVPYQTPTVGLFFFAPCYIKLLKNFHLVNSPVQFITVSKYETANASRNATGNFYPIGLLDGKIEIHFLHYQSEKEAGEKWHKRLARLNYNNLLFMFSAKDEVTDTLIEEFCNLPFKNKLCLSAKNISGKKEVVFFKQYEKLKQMPDADKTRIAVLKKINFSNLLNSLPTKKSVP